MSFDPPPQPSPDEVVQLLTSSVGRIIRRLRVEANPDGLSLSQAAVLALLTDTDGMTNADLARAQSMKRQSMNTLMARLEADGYVQRRADPTDGRQVLYSLTPKGTAARQAITAAKHGWLRDAIAGLTREQQDALLVAAKLLESFAQKRAGKKA